MAVSLPDGDEPPAFSRSMNRSFAELGLAALAIGLLATSMASVDPDSPRAVTRVAHSGMKGELFETSDGCMACHNGLSTPSGEDVSIGTAWRASMMANSARDPYWQASVRREVLDHPERAAEIQDECAVCHMPMMRYQAQVNGDHAEVFAHLPIDNSGEGQSALAGDGVGCTLCHQILEVQLGSPASFNGRFTVDAGRGPGRRPVFGPFDIDSGRQRVMHSSSNFVPTRGDHIRSSELCATCHTLYTTARGRDGKETGRLPEQVPYLEWKHSSYTERGSCQTCHMPVVEGPINVASVLGQPRERLSRHDFRGGNFFMLSMLNRYRGELGVTALPGELDASARRAVELLQRETVELAIDETRRANGRVEATISIRNLTGHKFPTAYPSRRAWLHVTLRDSSGRIVFESGKVEPNGSITGNDNDTDAGAFEPHHPTISGPDQVQIFESVMAGVDGKVTTGLLTAVRYVKDNRLLPEGFDKQKAAADIAVHGEASSDSDFQGGGDRVRYSMPVPAGAGPLQLSVEMRFQPIGFRWARNLAERRAEEIDRFTSYYQAMAPVSSVRLTGASATVR
jgi:hypothetical protein